MVLSEEEKRERNRKAAAKYRAKLNAEQKKKNSYNTEFSHARNFIEKSAKKADLNILRDLIAERQKKLSKKS